MSFFLKPAHSSAVKKSRAKTPSLRGSSSRSPFSSAKRTKAASSRSQSKQDGKWDVFDEELEDCGLIRALETDQRLRDVPQHVNYIRNNMFDDIPERAGMNSTTTAEVLNYQRNMPRITTRAHVHALSKSPTASERETAELLRSGILRRIEIPGRGRGGQDIGDCLVLTDDWINMVRQAPSLADELKDKYIKVLQTNKGATKVEGLAFTQFEAISLTQAGFLTNPSALGASSLFRPDSATLGSLTSLASAGSRNVSGSQAAVGGAGAIHEVGGSGSSLGNMRNRNSAPLSTPMNLTIPSTGVFLRLLAAAREHLVQILSRCRYRHAPLDILRERWDGAVDVAGSLKQATGTTMSRNVTPAKTRKWKRFYGLRFQWVLEECLGTGLVEVFDTGSVGLGVRVVAS